MGEEDVRVRGSDPWAQRRQPQRQGRRGSRAPPLRLEAAVIRRLRIGPGTWLWSGGQWRTCCTATCLWGRGVSCCSPPRDVGRWPRQRHEQRGEHQGHMRTGKHEGERRIRAQEPAGAGRRRPWRRQRRGGVAALQRLIHPLLASSPHPPPPTPPPLPLQSHLFTGNVIFCGGWGVPFVADVEYPHDRSTAALKGKNGSSALRPGASTTAPPPKDAPKTPSDRTRPPPTLAIVDGDRRHCQRRHSDPVPPRLCCVRRGKRLMPH